MPRIAVCKVCNTMERLPDPPADVRQVPAVLEWDDMGVRRKHEMTNPDGTVIMVPEYDPLLEDVVGRHSHGLPDTDVIGAIQLFPVEQSTWEKLDVVTELKSELAKMTGELFEEKNHYGEEALKCYNAHHNPKLDCPDFCDDSKRIGPKAKRKRDQVYLCYMCPVMQTYVAQEARQKAGLYNPEKIRRRKRR